METKHTPGPWVAGWNGGLTGPTCPSGKPFAAEQDYVPVAMNDECVAIVAVPDARHGIGGTAEANARLIAASPELLEACDDLMLMVCEAAQLGHFDNERFAKARAAIAKATGAAA